MKIKEVNFKLSLVYWPFQCHQAKTQILDRRNKFSSITLDLMIRLYKVKRTRKGIWELRSIQCFITFMYQDVFLNWYKKYGLKDNLVWYLKGKNGMTYYWNTLLNSFFFFLPLSGAFPDIFISKFFGKYRISSSTSQVAEQFCYTSFISTVALDTILYFYLC